MAPAQEPRIAAGLMSPGVEDLERAQQLLPEERGAAALEGERGQRGHHRERALAVAEVRLHAPQRHDDPGRDAVALLDPAQQRRVRAQQVAAAPDPVARHHVAAVLGEGEPALGLAPVEFDHARDRLDPGQRAIQRACAHALG
jgi:hypothetical protein